MPSSALLRQVSEGLDDSWRTLALRLELTFNQIDQIAASRDRDMPGQILVMLHRWRDTVKTLDDDQRIEILANALNDIGKTSLATIVRSEMENSMGTLQLGACAIPPRAITLKPE